MKLDELIVDAADALLNLDRSGIPFGNYQPGVGPYGETKLVAAVVASSSAPTVANGGMGSLIERGERDVNTWNISDSLERGEGTRSGVRLLPRAVCLGYRPPAMDSDLGEASLNYEVRRGEQGRETIWRRTHMANPPDAGERYKYSLVEIPTKTAWSMIAGALIGAFFLYVWAGKSFTDYIAKLADLMMQGAILTILFASLAKGIVVMLTRR